MAGIDDISKEKPGANSDGRREPIVFSSVIKNPIGPDIPIGFKIELPEELWRAIEEAQRLLKAMQPLAEELAKTFGALRSLFENSSIEEANAALQNLRQTLDSAADLFAAIERIDEQRLITLVAAFEKIADDLQRIPADIPLPGARPNAVPLPLPPPRKPAPPILLPRPPKPGILAGGPASGQSPEPRASGGPVSAYAPYMVGERGPELFVPRGAGSIVPSHQLGSGSSWPWSGSSPEIGEARGAIEDLQALLDELGFDWQNTFERMKSVLLDFAETGKFEWRDLAKIALEAIEGMLMRWLDLQQQTAAGSGGTASGKTNWWRVAAELAYTAASAYFSRGASGASGASTVNGTTAGSGGPASGQFKAAGGPVSAFSPYVVGERGPELFIPRVPGDIVPNHALGSAMGEASRPSVNQTIVFNVSPGVPEAVRREVAAMIPAITQAAKAGVASDIDRNGELRRRMN